MTLRTAKPGNFVDGEKLLHTQANILNEDLPKALDGVSGGTYAPSAPLVVNGPGGIQTGKAPAASTDITNKSYVDALIATQVSALTTEINAAKEALRTGYGTFEVTATSFANNAFLTFVGSNLSAFPRTPVLKQVNGDDFIGLPDASNAKGLWAIFLALDFSGTADATSSVELIQHTGNPSTGTMVQRFSAGANSLGRCKLSDCYQFRVDTFAPSPKFSFRVDSANPINFAVGAGSHRKIYITQLSKDL